MYYTEQPDPAPTKPERTKDFFIGRIHEDCADLLTLPPEQRYAEVFNRLVQSWITEDELNRGTLGCPEVWKNLGDAVSAVCPQPEDHTVGHTFKTRKGRDKMVVRDFKTVPLTCGEKRWFVPVVVERGRELLATTGITGGAATKRLRSAAAIGVLLAELCRNASGTCSVSRRDIQQLYRRKYGDTPSEHTVQNALEVLVEDMVPTQDNSAENFGTGDDSEVWARLRNDGNRKGVVFYCTTRGVFPVPTPTVYQLKPEFAQALLTAMPVPYSDNPNEC